MGKQQSPWCTKSILDVLDVIQTRESGLTKEEVDKRIEEYGANTLPEGKTMSLLNIFLQQFQSPLIYVLFVAAVIVLLLGEVVDAYIIFAVLLFNSIVGTVQEGKAKNALLALKKYTETTATVLRDGKERIISDTEIVPGDIVILQEGERVPADARIIFSNTLKTDEASLTGESYPIIKTVDVLSGADLSVADQRNMVFKGTNILSGNGVAAVVATGLSTEIGKIAKTISTVDTEIPLKTNISYLSRFTVVAVVAISFLLIFIGVLTGKELRELFVTAVALAVSVIPEGLPIVMTIVLVTGVRRMAKRDVLVKRLQAVEALGQTKVIAVDKTGTLTRNEMVIQRIYVDGHFYEITGNGYEPEGEVLLDRKLVDPLNTSELLLSGRIASFCANASLSFREDTKTWKVAGDPTEASMIVLSEKFGFRHGTLDKEIPKIFELPFDYQRKYHATIRSFENKNFLSVVGAPENVLKLCKNIWHNGKSETLHDEKKKELEIIFLDLAKEGYRVVAYAVNQNAERSIDPDSVPPLSFVGFFGMNDALRPEVKESVNQVRAADMRVVMITGDHSLTAQAIAKEAGIWNEGDQILTGLEIDSMSDEKLAKRLSRTTVFARVTPSHKLHIIQAYRKLGEIVAMTGDGVNDAPSLAAADLGVSMGMIGTEVAKEASDIILLNDNFASIVAAAEEGRSIFKSIKKVILYLFSTNSGEVLVIMGALILGWPLPLHASQIIWLNVVTDSFLDVSLAMEPKEEGLMHGKYEKPNKWIIDGLMGKRMLSMALPMAIGTLYLFYKFANNGEGFVSGANFDLTKAWSASLTTLTVFQWFNVLNCRSEKDSIFQSNPFRNKFLNGAFLIVISLQFIALYTPFLQKILHTIPLSFSEWSIIILVASSVIVIEEIRKFFYRRKLKR